MLIFDWTGWTKWAPLVDLDLATVPNTPGAYVIATDRPISRAVGVDQEGFLTVGESGKLSDRLWGFRECVTKPGAKWHSAGWRFAYFKFQRHFPVASLRVRWAALDTKAAAYSAEGTLLLAYLREHGELPPLNYKFNWQALEGSPCSIIDGEP